MEPTGAAPLRPTDVREIGPYRLLGRLGEGGMGTVFLAIAPTGRPVAVKVVRAEFANQEGFAGRFHAEVENARRVASFCTAQVLDNGNGDDGRPYMVTEYIAGTPLSEQITKYGALEPGPLHGVALGVAAALAAIHVAGLVHRDLKPANVILSMSGPRVIDFGIARALDRESNFTMSGELLGSPGWWAPEQVRGKHVTPAADIFSWGCLIAYSGSGRHPFGRGDAITMATRVLHTPPDLGALPAPLNELVRRATHMDPFQRPSAQDLLIALVGGSVVSPTIAQAEAPPTVAATEILTESWEPPPNVAAESEVTAALALPAPRPGTAPGLQEPADRDTDRIPGPPRHESEGEGEGEGDQGEVEREDDPLRGRRWLIAAGAAALAVVVTVAVLFASAVPGVRQGVTVSATGQPTAAGDVGRRFALGPGLDDPQLIVTAAPECGLTDYQGSKPVKGRFCLVRWTLLNPGGAQRQLGAPVLTLVDKSGGRHDLDDSSSDLPGVIPAGGRIDAVSVFDLPNMRAPATLSGTMFDQGEQIEVRLS